MLARHSVLKGEKMKRNLKILGNSILVLCATLSMSACNVASKNANQKTQATDWKVSFEYEAPEQEGGTWKRTLVVEGYDSAFLPIDLQQEGSPAWAEIGKTDDQGRFKAPASEGMIRYRIGGEQLTDWVSEQRDVMITSFRGPSIMHQGIRCIVPLGTTLFIGSGELTLNCDNVRVSGNVYAFPGPVPSNITDTVKKQTGGNLLIDATTVEVGGQINIQGESGYYSGDGGSVVINYKLLRTVPERIDAAPGGVSPRDTNGWLLSPWHPVAGLAGSVVLNKKENTDD